MSEERFLGRLTWPEVESLRERGVDAVLIPIGSTEQHGRHMPLDTDCFIAQELCRRAADLAEQEGVSLLVAPTLNVTLSWYHMQFPGSMRLSTTTFLQVFREVCDSLVHHGFQNLLAVNGHGGNIAALTVAVNHYMETTGRRVFLLQWWDLAADVLADVEGPLIHAEEAETSIALALGQRVVEAEATREAYDRGLAVREAGHPWTSLGKYGLVHRGPGVVVPMDMLRDISPSGSSATPRWPGGRRASGCSRRCCRASSRWRGRPPPRTAHSQVDAPTLRLYTRLFLGARSVTRSMRRCAARDCAATP